MKKNLPPVRDARVRRTAADQREALKQVEREEKQRAGVDAARAPLTQTRYCAVRVKQDGGEYLDIVNAQWTYEDAQRVAQSQDMRTFAVLSSAQRKNFRPYTRIACVQIQEVIS